MRVHASVLAVIPGHMPDFIIARRDWPLQWYERSSTPHPRLFEEAEFPARTAKLLIDARDSLDSPYAEKRKVGQGIPAGRPDFFQNLGRGRYLFLIYQYRPNKGT